MVVDGVSVVVVVVVVVVLSLLCFFILSCLAYLGGGRVRLGLTVVELVDSCCASVVVELFGLAVATVVEVLIGVVASDICIFSV